MTPVIEARGITKRFPGVIANREIDYALEKGEIHALLGENGAGKSTLMNILYGLYHQDEGDILVRGKVVRFHDPRDAIRHGIGMVHQHFMLVPVMTVTENIMIGEETTTGSVLLSAAAAAAIGGGIAWLLGGMPAAIYWVIVTAVYLLLGLLRLKLRIGHFLMGVLTGVGFGVLYEILSRRVLASPFAIPAWPAIGALIGGIANLRWLDKQSVARRVEALSREFGLDVNPQALVSALPVGAQQRVEIIKALYRDAEVLILDEPTAVLTPQEADDLFKVMRRLAERGVSIIFITHKLREVLAIADRITVLRRGQVVGVTVPAEATRESLARMMVGREVLLQVRKSEPNPTDVVLDVQNLQVDDDRHHRVVKGISFQLRAGEIVGVAGVQGNGQTELVEAITRLREVKGGTIHVLGQDVTQRPPRMVTSLGTGHIPEDRQRYGLVLTYPVADNLILSDYYHPPFSQGIILDEAHIADHAQQLISEFDIRTPSLFIPAGNLSGGNQQKVIVARELTRKPRLLIASQPTRGLDIGSIEFIHNEIVAARDAGAGVLLVSAELDEIMSLSDRIIVIYHGQLVAEMPASEATRERLGLLMAGIEHDKQPALQTTP